jgi:WD40 repeat protein
VPREQPLPEAPILAAPTRHPRRRLIAATALIATAVAAAVTTVAVARGSGPVRHVPFPQVRMRRIATLTDPGDHSYQGVTSVAFSPDGTILAAGDADDSIYLWDVATRRVIATLNDPSGQAARQALRSSGVGVTSVAFSPDGTMLAASNGDGLTYLWDVPTRRVIATLTAPDTGGGIPQAVAFSSLGTTLAVGDSDGSTYLWGLPADRLTAVLADPAGSNGVGSVAFSPDGTLAVGDGDGDVYLWDARPRSAPGDRYPTGRLTTTLTDPGSIYSELGVTSLAFSRAGALAAGDFGSALLWQAGRASRPAILANPGSSVPAGNPNEDYQPIDNEIDSVAVAFSPNGMVATSNGYAGNICLWAGASRIATVAVPGQDVIASLAFGPNGRTLAAGGSVSGTIYLWSVG